MSELVFKRPCGRCPAEQEIPVTIEDVKAGKIPSDDATRALKVAVGDQIIVDYDYLCDACMEICFRYVTNIGKRLEKKASTRERSSADGEEDGE